MLLAVTALGFALVVSGLLQLQLVQSERWLELSKTNHVRREVRRAPRGIIRDRRGEVLADDRPGFNVVFRPFPAESASRAPLPRDWMLRTATLCDVDTAVVERAVRAAGASGQTALVRRNAPMQVVAAVEEMRNDLPGIEVVSEPLRRYPHGTLAVHLLGYAGQVTEADLERYPDGRYRSGDLIGRSGVERSYEDVLRGEDGHEDVVVNAMGRRVEAMAVSRPTDPVAGGDLVLTLDLRLQRALEEAMARVRAGAAVALDPRDGGVLALVSRPGFDPNEFSEGLSESRWDQLSSGGDNPLLNRAVQGLYPPGSTFKLVTMAGALRARAASRDTRLSPCTGAFAYGGRTFHCWERSGHGSLDLIGALAHSCDAYFYQVGLRTGLPRLEATARAFGLGERTGVDLPQEKKGLVPGTAWYDRRWGEGRWRKGLLLNLSIGQGELLATPLQLALMTAQIANGGLSVRPHVVLREPDGRPRQAPPVRTPPGPVPADIRTVRQAMEQAVASGTGGRAAVPGLRVAGKTGTSQNPHGEDHALFVCYAPAEGPTVAMAIVVENGGHGGTTAAPIAGWALRRYFFPDSALAAAPAAADSGAAYGD